MDPRKLLARLEPQARSPVPQKRRRNVGTAPDARRHSPPPSSDREWRRCQRILDALRLELWHGSSRIHTPSATRCLADPQATANIDVSGALGFTKTSRRAIAINVYLYKNWTSYRFQVEQVMEQMVMWLLIGMIGDRSLDPWARKLGKSRKFADEMVERMVVAVLQEFTSTTHCEACRGYGLEQTGVRVGEPCVKCRGTAVVQWNGGKRARALRVRKRDWFAVWSGPHLALLDFLVSLERLGKSAHGDALAA